MQLLPKTTDDAGRLAALAEFDILDTPTEALFDAFTRLAATMCGAQISLMALVAEDRQWFKSTYGLEGVSEMPRAGSFCDYTIRQPGVHEVADATKDARFAKHPIVTGDPHVRFYAGAPLITHDGHAIGTICVLDREPRVLNETQRTALIEVAGAIVDQLETRRALLRERNLANEQVHVLSGALGVTTEAVAIATLTDGDPARPATIVYANDAFLKLKRGTAEEIVGHDARRFSGPLTDAAAVNAMRESALRGEACRADYISYKLDGSHYYASFATHPLVDENGVTTHMVTIQRDVSDLVLRDRRLAMENERLTVLTSIARSIFAALDPHALIRALVAGARELLDADARLLVALPGGGFGATDDLLAADGVVADADPFLASAAASAVPVVADDGRRGAMRIAGSVGETRYIIDLRREEPLQTADVFAMGLLAQYVAVAARNVELYSELQARRTAVVELNEVKNDLIAMLAHDFKGPLTTIVGFADVLAEDERFDDESRKFLAMISSSAMRLASLATDTLALSRLEQNELTLNVESFDLVALVRDIVRVFSVTRQIDMTSDRAELRIVGDPARLRQVFENLIGNAIKYSPNGEPIDIALVAKGRGVEVAVHDQGIGIPEADRPKLFGRFARAQNARAMGIGGTGFGLYLTKTIVEMHGGSVDVESSEGHGSTFRVFVPASVAVKRPQHRRFILLDAAGDARSYVAHTLRDDGFAATVVNDATELLAQVDETQFDAALVDTERVGMKLDEFVRRVAGRTALIRIDASNVDEVPGWDGYLVKPFLTKDLRAAIDAAIMRHPRRKPESVLTYAKGAAGM
jgi:signal transduction histidine kinase/PAS domain-containing protein